MSFAVEKNELLTGKGYDAKKVGLMSDERWKSLYDLMREVNVMTKEIDYTAAFDLRFIDAAVAALG